MCKMYVSKEKVGRFLFRSWTVDSHAPYVIKTMSETMQSN